MMGLDDPATAIFATNPMTTLGIMRRAQERGIDVPGQVSVVGVDDSDVRTHVWPRLSAVTQDASALGLEAAVWLTQTITSGKSRVTCRRTIATDFEANGTSGPAPEQRPSRQRSKGPQSGG